MGLSGSTLFSRLKSIHFNWDLISPVFLAVFSGLALYALTSSWPGDTHDGETHIRRVEALTAALQAGVIYPRWLPELMFGYGKPVLNYYSPGFYYPVALLSFAGLDLISSIRIVLSVGFALSAWWMFRLSRLFVSMWPSIVSVICFQFFPYRIYDLFIRGAFPEFSAFIWLPLIAFFTVRAATVDRNDTGRYSHPVLVASAGIAWAGLILTHNLTALMAVLMLGASLALFWALQYRVQAHWLRIFSVGIFSVAIGASLAAWYILPALTELGWVMNGRRLFAGLGMSHLLDWRVLFSWGVVYLLQRRSTRTQATNLSIADGSGWAVDSLKKATTFTAYSHFGGLASNTWPRLDDDGFKRLVLEHGRTLAGPDSVPLALADLHSVWRVIYSHGICGITDVKESCARCSGSATKPRHFGLSHCLCNRRAQPGD